MDDNQEINLLIEEHQKTDTTDENFVEFPKNKVSILYLTEQLRKSAQRWGLQLVTMGNGNPPEYAIEHVAKDIRELFYGDGNGRD